MRRLPSSKSRVERLLDLVRERSRVLVLVHDNPDPDAMAGAMALSHLVESAAESKARIVYGGIVGRAENRNMVEMLDIPLWRQESIRLRPDDVFLTVDTQPGFGNNSLPDGADVLAVLDHHPSNGPLFDVPLVDVRTDYGAVATIATEYLVSAGVDIPRALATALCYGISSETQDLGREAAEPDIAAYMAVFPLADQPLLGGLRYPRRPATFFANLHLAIEATRLAEGIAICHMDSLSSPDLAAEIADMLLSIEGVHWVLVTGRYGNTLVLSVRTDDREAHAGQLLRRVVGETSRAGGHGMIAGGSLILDRKEDHEPRQREVEEGFLAELGKPDLKAERLVDQPGAPPTDVPL